MTGVLSVMTHGPLMMPMWHVDNWDLGTQVRNHCRRNQEGGGAGGLQPPPNIFERGAESPFIFSLVSLQYRLSKLN